MGFHTDEDLCDSDHVMMKVSVHSIYYAQLQALYICKLIPASLTL